MSSLFRAKDKLREILRRFKHDHLSRLVNREDAQLELDTKTLRPQDASPEARAMLESAAEIAAWHAQRTAFDEKVAEAPSPLDCGRASCKAPLKMLTQSALDHANDPLGRCGMHRWRMAAPLAGQ